MRLWRYLFLASVLCVFGAVLPAVAQEAPRMSMNVKAFGVVGDGVTNDTVALQALANSIKDKYSIVYQRGLYASSFPEVVFPAGTYRISRMIIWPNWVVLRGEGQAVIEQTDPKADVFYIHWGYRVLVDNLTFEGGRRSIKLWTQNADCATLNIRNCTFRNSGDYAIECIVRGTGQNNLLGRYQVNADGTYHEVDDPAASYYFNSTLLHIDRCKFERCMKVLHSNADGGILENSEIETHPDMRGAAIVCAALTKLENVRGLAHVRPGNEQRWIDLMFGELHCRNLDFRADGPQGMSLVHNFPKHHSGYQSIHAAVIVEECAVQAAGSAENALVYCREVPNMIAVRQCREASGKPVRLLGFAREPDAAYFKGGASPVGLAFTFAGNDRTLEEQIPAAMQPYLRQPVSKEVEAMLHKHGAVPRRPETFMAREAIPVKGTLYAEKFGVVGDGKVDDTAALQKAFDAAAQRPGVELLIPGGMYRVSRSLRVPGQISIRGLGKAVFKTVEQGAPDVLVVQDARAVAIEHCHFEGGMRAVRFLLPDNHPARLLIRNCVFNMTEATAVECVSDKVSIDVKPVVRLRITDSLFFRCKQALVSNVEAMMDSVWITSYYAEGKQPPLSTPVISNKGRLYFTNILGVPLGNTSRWIDNYHVLCADFVRFGGEEGGRCPVQVFRQGHPNIILVQNGWLYGLYAGSRDKTGLVHCVNVPDLLVLRHNIGIDDTNLPNSVGLEAIEPRGILEKRLVFSGNTVPENVFYENGWAPAPVDRPGEAKHDGTDPTLYFYRFEPDVPLADWGPHGRTLEKFWGGAQANAPGLTELLPYFKASNRSALALNGKDQFTRLLNGVTPKGSFTLELLFRLDAPLKDNTALAGIFHWNAANKSYALYMNPNTKRLIFMVSRDGKTDLREAGSHTAIEPGKVYYAAGVFVASTGELELYVQNHSDNTPLVLSGHNSFGEPARAFPSTHPFDIGASASGYNLFHGVIDEVRLCNRALAPADFFITPYTPAR
jgi:hypothetical protein